MSMTVCLSLGEHISSSAGLMPTEASGNYLHEPPYLRETKTYHSQPLESTRHAGNYFVPLSVRPIFIFFVAEVMSNYLTRPTDGLKKNFSTSGGPLRPEARGICHMVNPALTSRTSLHVQSSPNSFCLLRARTAIMASIYRN